MAAFEGLRAGRWVTCRNPDQELVLAEVVGFSVGMDGKYHMKVRQDSGQSFSLDEGDFYRKLSKREVLGQ